jgi:hypothetical protein
MTIFGEKNCDRRRIKLTKILQYFIFTLEIGLAIEFLKTSESIQIMIPLKVLYAMMFLIIAGTNKFLWVK